MRKPDLIFNNYDYISPYLWLCKQNLSIINLWFRVLYCYMTLMPLPGMLECKSSRTHSKSCPLKDLQSTDVTMPWR